MEFEAQKRPQQAVWVSQVLNPVMKIGYVRHKCCQIRTSISFK